MRPASLARQAWLFVVVGASIVVLAGCVKVDIDLTVASDDTASGTYIVALDKSLLRLTDQQADDLVNQLKSQFEPVPEGAKVDAGTYDEGDFSGAKVTITDMPIDKVNVNSTGVPQSGSDVFSLTR